MENHKSWRRTKFSKFMGVDPIASPQRGLATAGGDGTHNYCCPRPIQQSNRPAKRATVTNPITIAGRCQCRWARRFSLAKRTNSPLVRANSSSVFSSDCARLGEASTPAAGASVGDRLGVGGVVADVAEERFRDRRDLPDTFVFPWFVGARIGAVFSQSVERGNSMEPILFSRLTLIVGQA